MTFTIASGLRTIAGISVTQLKNQGMPSNRYRDRWIVTTLDCGHVKNVSLPLSAPIPRVGEVSFCLACRLQGIGK